MATLAEVRQKYPQYNDMSDEQLATALHRKFYSDMDRVDFDKRIGLAASPVSNDQRIEQAFDGSNDIVKRQGTILPVSNLQRRSQGLDRAERLEGDFPDSAKEQSFDSSAGLLGAFISGVTLPGDVATGKVQVMDDTGRINDQVIGRSLELAGTITPAGAAAKAVRPRTIPARMKNDAPPTLQRVTDADEFGIALSQGQGIRTQALQAQEEDILKGVRGNDAQRILQRQRDAQRQQVDEALLNVRNDIAPGSSESAVDAGYAIREGVTDRAQELRSLSNEAFKNVENMRAEVEPTAMRELEKRVFDRLDRFGANEGTSVAPDFPVARRLFKRIQELSTGANAPQGSVTGVNVGALQKIRSQLSKNAQGGDAQSAAIREMRKGLEEFMDDVVVRNLVSGDPRAIDELKRATGLWRSYKGILNSPNLAMRKIAKGSLDGSQVANLIVGASQVGSKQAGASVVREIKRVLGPDAPQIDELKRGVITRLFNDTARGENKTYGKLASDINRFISKDSPELARELFGKEDLAKLRRLSGVLRSLTTDDFASNPSSSGQALARMIGNAFRSNVPILGFAAGDLTGLLAGLALSPAMNRMAVRKANRLAQTPRLSQVSQSRRTGGAGNRLLVPSAALALPIEE